MKSRFLFVILALLVTLTASLTGLSPAHGRGGWETSGAPMPPYIPDFDFEFTCRVTMLASVDSPGYQQLSTIYRISNRDLNGGYASIETKRSDRWTMKQHDREIPVRSTSKLTWLDGQSIGLRFSEEAGSGRVMVHLSIGTHLQVGTQRLSSYQNRAEELAGGHVSVSSSITVEDKGRSTNHLSASVSCERTR